MVKKKKNGEEPMAMAIGEKWSGSGEERKEPAIFLSTGYAGNRMLYEGLRLRFTQSNG